jgi:tetratricopeptide (TPR) repeat protein
MPVVLAHPEFLYPNVPASLASTSGASRVDIGWRYLQSDDLANADLEFGVALKLGPRLYPARVGQGYVAMARRDWTRALSSFDAALEANTRYVPALVGRGQALLALDRTELALTAFESALEIDPTMMDLGRRVEVLRFREMQIVIDGARTLAAEGRVEEARSAYDRAVAASPDSAFLYRERGLLERRAGNPARAIDNLRQAVRLDPADAEALVAIGELLQEQGDYIAAEAAYRDASTVDPSLDLTGRIADAALGAREAGLAPAFRAALESARLTRGGLSALIGVRLQSLVERAPARQVVMTDVQGHWAVDWITAVAGGGLIEAFENHTFQPELEVRRGDLAVVISKLVALLPEDAAAKARQSRPLTITDVNPGHLQYEAASGAVALGLMALDDTGRFNVARQVSGPEAAEVVMALRRLASRLGVAPR